MEVVTKSDDTLSRPGRPGPGKGALMGELKPQHINGYFLKVYNKKWPIPFFIDAIRLPWWLKTYYFRRAFVWLIIYSTFRLVLTRQLVYLTVGPLPQLTISHIATSASLPFLPSALLTQTIWAYLTGHHSHCRPWELRTKPIISLTRLNP